MQMVISEFVEPHEHEIKHEWNSFKSTHSKKKRTFNPLTVKLKIFENY
jgi:hypothetical protein